ncbi:MAG: sugar transferase [Fluviicola sp.]|jgi:lipopolysaccharide/colanic/teichoic acid biosynthesis glycosyltransferase|uniref:sugar transferase n=1 Tax=Fluviicola sp. TaxID=1917219 RepID=UPI00261DBAF4|nr:sugar transferase [Fluviicola sp.]MDF3028622.1 sugar transferase [Fluviicola sp.]
MMKRLFDIFVSLIILAIFLPFGILISLAIVLESKGGAFYRQKRVGKNGVLFKLWKFRTMRVDADKQGKLTVGMRDPRITRVGYFIRKSKLDEFPQFINVLTGEMSIVGPRPEVQEYVDLYTSDQRMVLSVKPGITDYASLEYFKENELLGQSENPRETYIHEIMPAKIELNKKYIANPTLSQDIKIMWLTFLKMIR